jgi:photosystem II stability/assembly factor-like uncharacterized protein
LGVEPAFSFVDSRHGWIGWPTTSSPLSHLIRTSDGGQTWRSVPADDLFALVHLTFLNPLLGYAAVSHEGGPEIGVTRDGGTTWVFRDDPLVHALRFPDVTLFLTPQTGWMGGTTSDDDGRQIRPAVIRTDDGGTTWHRSSFPSQTVGNPIDIQFLDPERGWLVVWNDNPSALFKTRDGGATWSEDVAWRNGTLSSDGPRAVRFVSPEVGVLIVGHTVVTTTDGGATWRRTDVRVSDLGSCEVVRNEVWCVSGMELLKIRPQG